MTYLYQKKHGFSLVEVLVAISILLLVIVGPMTMISRSNNSTAFATEQITAFFLAQEGLELVQKQRDDFLLEHFENPGTYDEPWTKFKTHFALCDVGNSHPNGCALQIEDTGVPNTEVVRDCDTLTDCRLQLDDSSNPGRLRYHYDAGDPNSLFTRTVKMNVLVANSGDQEVLLTSTVTWRTGTLIRSQQVEATTYLFNVYDKQ